MKKKMLRQQRAIDSFSFQLKQIEWFRHRYIARAIDSFSFQLKQIALMAQRADLPAIDSFSFQLKQISSACFT